MTGPEVSEPGIGIVDELATALMGQWAKSEPEHSVTKHPTSYVATFVELARTAYLLTAARARAEVEADYRRRIYDRLSLWSADSLLTVAHVRGIVEGAGSPAPAATGDPS